ncbi:hypothetical protein [Sorangium sp. So ce1024]|uniref:hypothetical protein n=1 Tax=Sorangium sp. So ce1024 TaxID=3133327 RepID=UPI003F11B6E2
MTRYAVLAVLVWGSACGGNVVVDGMPDGSGGAGATSTSSVGPTSTSAVGAGPTSSTGSWMTSAAVTSSSTGAAGGDPWSMCVNYCAYLHETCDEPAIDCIEACDDQLSQAAHCNRLLVPFLECALNEAHRCEPFPRRCRQHLAQYDRCTRGLECDPLACSGSNDTTCYCEGSCNGLDLAVQCNLRMPTGVRCTCFAGGKEVAVCEDVGPACDLAFGCCQPIFDALD